MCQWNYRGEWNKQYQIEENIFDVIDNAEKAYWLGFIYAEGGIDKSAGYKLVINQHIKNIGQLKAFKVFLKSDVPIKLYPHYKSPRATIRICRKKIVDNLAKYGIMERKSATLKFPNIQKEYYADFIRGYFDGDGSLGYYVNHRNRKKPDRQLRISIYSKAENFLKIIRSILIKHCKLNKVKLKITGNKDNNVYCLAYAGNLQVPRILNYLKIMEA